MVQYRGSRFMGYIIQVTGRVRIIQVNGRRRHLIAQGQRTEYDFHTAGSAEHVAAHGFRGTDRQFPGMLTENLFDGIIFGKVAGGRRSAVGIDVVDSLFSQYLH